ncbi:MAG: hypothetical protein AAGF98_09325, partial [Cyanobacteria bacterium P01_H01_bin.153]
SNAIAVLACILSFGMFTAGYEKYQNWLDFDLGTNGVLSWFYPGYFNLDSQFLMADLVFKIPFWLLELMDYSAVLLELTPFLCLIAGARFWKAWLLTACMFHLANLLILNIPFGHHIPVYCCFFLCPLLQEEKIRNNIWFIKFVRSIIVFAILIGITHIAFRLSGNGVISFLKPTMRNTFSLLIDAVTWTALLILGSVSLWSHRDKEYVQSIYRSS